MSAHTLPADLFMRSVVESNGFLGWQQLCPAVKAQLPEAALVQQANSQRRNALQSGLNLTSEFVGARPRPSGGELRLYLVTAHWRNGTTQIRTYSVVTQGSGCVEDVLNQ
jgi:hypothetical protein